MIKPTGRAPLFLVMTGLVLSTGEVRAVPGGSIDTLRSGEFRCELPGDASGPVGHATPAEDFAVINANSYRTARGRGSYLLTGNRLTFTSGPKRGQSFRRISGNFLRKLAASGGDARLRCVRQMMPNAAGPAPLQP